MNRGLPTISQYIQSVREPYALFKTLGMFECERDIDLEPKHSSGNNGVIFKITRNQSTLLLKCYTNSTEFSSAIYNFVGRLESRYMIKAQLLPSEMYVYDHCENGAFYDVVIAPWIEGETLDKTLRRAAIYGDVQQLTLLAERFDTMALYLLSQTWAHGDIKPENIIVTPELQLILIDYDAMFIPDLAGKTSYELGTPPYQHHLRNNTMFNKNIDDYSLAIISTLIHAVALQPAIYMEYLDNNTDDFNSTTIHNGQSQLYDIIRRIYIDNGLHSMVAMSELLLASSPLLPSLERIFATITSNQTPQTTYNIDNQPFNNNSKWGYKDRNGRIIIEPIYDHADKFCQGLATVMLSGAWQYIDLNGNLTLSDSRWEDIKRFGENIAAVCIEAKWGYINRCGEWVIKPMFEIAGSMRNNMALVKYNGKYGYIDSTGAWVITPRFEYATGFKDGKAIVKKGEKTFYIDKYGDKV